MHEIHLPHVLSQLTFILSYSMCWCGLFDTLQWRRAGDSRHIQLPPSRHAVHRAPRHPVHPRNDPRSNKLLPAADDPPRRRGAPAISNPEVVHDRLPDLQRVWAH